MRDAGAAPGPKFERNPDGDVLFTFVIDGSNVLGPRAATAADQAAHPGAWRLFCEAEGVGPLDRDARDGDGGSLPKSDDTRPRRRRKVSADEPAVDRPEGH